MMDRKKDTDPDKIRIRRQVATRITSGQNPHFHRYAIRMFTRLVSGWSETAPTDMSADISEQIQIFRISESPITQRWGGLPTFAWPPAICLNRDQIADCPPISISIHSAVQFVLRLIARHHPRPAVQMCAERTKSARKGGVENLPFPAFQQPFTCVADRQEVRSSWNAGTQYTSIIRASDYQSPRHD
jgi:hypothetical protein